MGAAWVGGVDGDLGGGESEDEPAVADVDVGETQYVLEERAVGCGVLGVDDEMRAVDHAGDRGGVA